MIRLLYISQAISGIMEDHIQGILQSSRRNNPTFEITGVLVHGGGLFMQILEGPEQNVLRQYVKLLDDQRHSHCQIIHISPANERIFQQLSMGAIQCDPLKFQDVAKMRNNRLESVNAKVFKKIMREFLDMLNTLKEVEK